MNLKNRFCNFRKEGKRQFWSIHPHRRLFIYYDLLHNGVGLSICIWRFGIFLATEGQTISGFGWLTIRWGSRRWYPFRNKQLKDVKYNWS